MLVDRPSGQRAWRLLPLLLLFAAWKAGSGQLHYSVLEESKHGTFVGRIAQDLGLELAELVPRLFRLTSKGLGDLLEVNLQNGILFVNGRIDREELCGRSAECSIHLEVIVDRPLQVFHVEVEVKDINDNPPVFSLLISESKQPDSHFPLEGASDADIGVNAELTYRLSQNEYFSLEQPTHSKQTKRLSLTLKKYLDREKTPELNLLLTAVDGGKPELTGTVRLFIHVLDINDNDPEFEQSEYKVRLMENAAKETFVIKLNATDRDEGVNGEVTYSLMSVKPNGKLLFTLDENSGEVRVNGTLDYEENKFYEIEVQATDKGNPPMAGHCTVWVEILDANDNAPEVTVTSLSLPVREDTLPSTVIALISVSDPDSGANGQVICSLTSNVPFKIMSTFKNYYSLVLDSRRGELVVLAAEAAEGVPLQVFHVEVEVKDINDNPPVFREVEQKVLISESAPLDSHFPLEGASDADIGINSLLTYKLGLNEYFTLKIITKNDKSTLPELVLRKSLDREETPELNILLTSQDGGKPELTGSVQIKISILDVNDNAPEFDKPGYRVVLFENVPNGTRVIQLNASDLDEGVNREISYAIRLILPVSEKCMFSINPETGEIRIYGKLDFEENNEYEIQVNAIDKGIPSMAGHCTVLVEVLDLNDNTPEVTITSLSLPVREDAQVSTVIALISVSDRDSGANGQVTCTLTPQGACGPAKPALVCSSAVGSWSCSQQRRQRVCSGEGAPKADLMAFSPSLPQVPGSTEERQQPSESEHLGKVSLSRRFLSCSISFINDSIILIHICLFLNYYTIVHYMV
uniref:Cadherin domain-containing protein n=1 Tax=Suricata suricatta TaxID=37032 RepID=A0A673UIX1_SURSU